MVQCDHSIEDRAFTCSICTGKSRHLLSFPGTYSASVVRLINSDPMTEENHTTRASYNTKRTIASPHFDAPNISCANATEPSKTENSAVASSHDCTSEHESINPQSAPAAVMRVAENLASDLHLCSSVVKSK